MQTLSTDVVIIGGGGGGTYTALCLKKAGIQPLLIVKGIIGKSGASIFAGNMVLAGRVLDGTEEEAEATRDWVVRWYNHFLVDQDYVLKSEKWIENVYYPELDEIGLYLRRDNQGRIVKSYGAARGIAAKQQGQSGALFMDRRRKQVWQNEIPSLEETAVTKILQDGNRRAIGVVAFHYPTGEIYVVRAKAVVVATGPADRIATRATGTREQSGDGLALTYRAGGELVNLEIQWWHASDFKWPLCWQRMHVYPNPLVGTKDTARMYNADGECFFDQSRDAPNSYAPYPTQLKRVAQQAEAGKARMDGGYYTGYDHIDPQALKLYAHHMKSFEKVGLGYHEARVETAPTWHYRQGGVNLDPHTMMTNVPGLYVAGAVGGHNNGSIGFVTYDAYVCAESIKNSDLPAVPPPPPARQVEQEVARIQGLLREMPQGGVTPTRLKARIRDIMYTKMGFVKTKEGMESALEELRRMREEDVPRMGLKDTTLVQNYGWLDALDTFSLLDVSELTIRSALNRKESRGPFYRTDYPYTDNQNWIVKNILADDGTGKVRFRLEPYSLPYYKPEFEREDYFKVDW